MILPKIFTEIFKQGDSYVIRYPETNRSSYYNDWNSLVEEHFPKSEVDLCFVGEAIAVNPDIPRADNTTYLFCANCGDSFKVSQDTGIIPVFCKGRCKFSFGI